MQNYDMREREREVKRGEGIDTAERQLVSAENSE